MSNIHKKKEISIQEDFIDLSGYNLIEGMKKAIYYSTYNFLEYDNRIIRIKLKDEETRKIVSNLKLKNTILEIKQKELRKAVGIK